MNGTRSIDDLDHDAEALYAAVARFLRFHQFRDRDTICCHDISVTQCYALEAVVEHGPLRSSELALQLHLDKSTTSRVVDALVRKGYLLRRPDPADGRAHHLVATAAGAELHRTIEAELVEQHRVVLADLAPEVRGTLAPVIDRLTAAATRRFHATSCCTTPA
jgi:DNA-binding MarR family transcriptional regulator